ncbi:MAG: hypothetical protein ACRDKT_09050 [Actinomycetota bacterium]
MSSHRYTVSPRASALVRSLGSPPPKKKRRRVSRALAGLAVAAVGVGQLLSFSVATAHEETTSKDLTVIKSATGSFKRTFSWDVSKSVDQTTIQTSGDTATFNYTVAVTHDGGTDSNWRVTGLIRVSNPNDFDVPATITDATDNGGVCSVNNGSNTLTVPANNGVEVGYECLYSSAPTADPGTNTATATWPATGDLAAGSASGSDTFSFDSPDVVDDCATVTDSFNGGPAEVLGTVCHTDPSPTTFSYSRTVAVPAGGGGSGGSGTGCADQHGHVGAGTCNTEGSQADPGHMPDTNGTDGATNGPGTGDQPAPECPNEESSVNGDTDPSTEGANASGPYNSTCDGRISQNGQGDDAPGTGTPCAGCVGNADDKNPPGQVKEWNNDKKNDMGYECDGNQGVGAHYGNGNPAHTGCVQDTPPVCITYTNTAVLTTSKSQATKSSSITVRVCRI